jgi:rhodanese-related sulfurtransferase/DNA-binding transcriptional ArsR family regulator
MNKRQFKDKVYSELARIARSLANPHRMEIVELLGQGETSVEEIAQATNLTVANASQHLQVLKQAQLVEIKRQGNFIFYRLSSDSVFKAWTGLRELGIERIAEIGETVTEFRKSKFDFRSVTIDELVEKIASGNVVVLDVRPAGEYLQGHIAGSVSIPVDELSRRLKELPKRTEIVAYCRGPFCVYADEAVALLLNSGYKAKRLTEGFPDWKLKDLPVEVSLN